MDNETKLASLLFKQAKNQYKEKIIDRYEYEEILTLIYDNLSNLEENANKKNYLIQTFSPANKNLKLIDTINFTLALN